MTPVADAILHTVVFFGGFTLGYVTRDNMDRDDDQ